VKYFSELEGAEKGTRLILPTPNIKMAIILDLSYLQVYYYFLEILIQTLKQEIN